MVVTKLSAVQPVYSSKIIKAGALLADTHTLLHYWDSDLTPRQNLERIQTLNLLGKASRSRVTDILAIFRQRYLRDPAVASALSILAHGETSRETLDRILCFYSAQSDRLLHDTVIDLLAPLYRQGRVDISTGEVESFVRGQVQAGRTAGRWSRETTERVTQGLLSTLRDFGLLSGTVKKRLVTIYLPIRSFAYLAFALNRTLHSGERLLNSPEWQLFFLQPDAVERMLIGAHQEGLLQYHAAGRVIRLDFPAGSPEEYARALTQGAD